MRIRRSALLALLTMSVVACEDGPEQVFTPNEGDPAVQNGFDDTPRFTQPGQQGYDVDEENRDDTGRARFCSIAENEALIQRMVREPIVPNDSIGGVPMWNGNEPMQADLLIQDGAWCDPVEYANAFVWGPENEVIYLFNQDTRIVEAVIALQKYRGTLEGNFTGTREDGSIGPIPVKMSLRDRITIDGVPLDQASTGREDAADKERAWLNAGNVNKMYRMVRETHFGDEPYAPEYDCFEQQTCELIFANPEWLIFFRSSGVALVGSPEGQLTEVDLFPVRVAPFEEGASMRIGQGPDEVAPVFESGRRETCSIALSDGLAWSQFVDLCVGEGEGGEKTLSRASFNVYGQRDAVDVEFNGATFSFQRDVTQAAVLKDGERPAAEDKLFGISWTRTLAAPAAEFKQRTIAQLFKQKLEQRVREAVQQPAVGGGEPADAGVPETDAAVQSADAGVGVPADVDASSPLVPPVEQPTHPLLAWTLEIPPELLTDEADEPGPINQLTYQRDGAGDPRDWIGDVIADLRAVYAGLSPADRAVVDPRLAEATWIVEPFTDAIVEVFSHGRANTANAEKLFYNTDDRKWSIGFAYFTYEGEQYRLTVQFSLNFDSLSAVSIERGRSKLDDVYAGWNQRARPRPGLGQEKSPYYGADLARGDLETNPLALGGPGIQVLGFDRRLGTLDIELEAPREGGGSEKLELTVSGDPLEDRNGYLRQIRGRRYEFVPANVVQLQGRETSMIFWVEADGLIGRVAEGRFKHPVNLCPGLAISYGDDVRAKVAAFAEARGDQAFRDCEITYNYSANGNVLDEVVSLTNRVSFTISADRAVQVNLWR
jgi:hypothetical protein